MSEVLVQEIDLGAILPANLTYDQYFPNQNYLKVKPSSDKARYGKVPVHRILQIWQITYHWKLVS